jgi:hypothetical protein
MQGLCLVYSQLGIAKRQSRVFYNYLILSEPHMPTIAEHFSTITQLKPSQGASAWALRLCTCQPQRNCLCDLLFVIALENKSKQLFDNFLHHNLSN